MFKNAFSFEGRIRRTEFGVSVIIYMVAYLIIFFGSSLLAEEMGGVIMFVGLILFIPVLWFIIAQAAKRCHDLGNSGWYQLIPFYNLWLLFADSKVGPNEYGPNPKGEGNAEDINQIGQE